jgi:hypothetical protein
MTVRREACHHFLVSFLSVEDDDEPPDSSLSIGFFLQMEKMMTSLSTRHCLLVFFFKWKR